MAKAKSGGGITSNKNVRVGVRTGAPAKGVSPQSASRIGMQVITTTGPTKAPGPISVQLGNANAAAQGQGPGAGCTVSKPGTQGRH